MAIPTLVLVLLAMLEVVVVARLQLELVAAAREGVRVAATVVDPAAAVRATKDAVGPELTERIRVEVTRPSVPGDKQRFGHRCGIRSLRLCCDGSRLICRAGR